MVKLYDKFNPKGLEIFGVSLDIRMSSWTKAIENDKLSWNHVSNLKRWDDPIAENYGVESIPQLFLIDENSKVIAKVNEAHELLPYLEKVFNNNNLLNTFDEFFGLLFSKPFFIILSALPFKLLYLISDFIYPFVYHVVRYRRKIVRKT